MPKLFFSYSHKDERPTDQLEVQLAMLARQGVVETRRDRRITTVDDLDHAISAHVDEDDVAPLLVSLDFLASDYCFECCAFEAFPIRPNLDDLGWFMSARSDRVRFARSGAQDLDVISRSSVSRSMSCRSKVVDDGQS